MKSLAIAACLTLLAAPAALAGKCIPAGKSQSYGAMLPELGPGSGSGLPFSLEDVQPTVPDPENAPQSGEDAA